MKRVLRYWALVPVLWLAVAIGVMEPGTLNIRPNVAFEFSLLFYDPADIGAFVLRGANASMGRTPGRADEPLEEEPHDLARRLDEPQPPLADRYYLEYPTATLLLFRLGFLVPLELPTAIADSQQFSVSHFAPRNEFEGHVWQRFQLAAILHVVLMTISLYGLIAVLRRGYEPGVSIGPVWLCVLPAAVFFSLNRFDILPALATALAFAALGRKRLAWSGAFLAVGVLLKVYPVLFAPIILRHLGVRAGSKWLAGFAGTILLGIGLSTAFLGWEPTVKPILVQLARPLEEKSWTLYGRVLPLELGHAKNARLAILAGTVLLLTLTRPRDLYGVLRRCGVLLVVFISLAVFWSPQWVVWFLPLVIPLAARHRWLIPVCVVIDVLNYFQFPVLFWIVWSHWPKPVCEDIAEVVIRVRFGLWTLLAVGLLWCEFRSRNRERCPAPSPSG
jgi:hypothetical protein